MESLFSTQFQIVSDLHLETPFQQPSYKQYQLNSTASHLCLLGDIGLVKDNGLLVFLERLLKQTPNLTIFYILDNHEAYQISFQDAHITMLVFANKTIHKYS
jgi:hypothetical protein